MKNERARYEDRIIQDPRILVGKPVVKGTRIPVELVLGHLAANPDLAELFAAYPRLTVEDVQACLAQSGGSEIGSSGSLGWRPECSFRGIVGTL